MAIKKDASGRRSVEISFELPGSPEQVWHAIATGPGISAWFVPSEIEERVGGAVAFHLGPDMTSSGHVTRWEPPHRIEYEEPGWSGDAPPLATEFIVEARSGGMCTLRIIHSLFAESRDDWDDEIGSMESGWAAFIEVLRVYLRYFPGQPAASIRPTGPFQGSQDEAWQAVSRALNLTGASIGEARDTSISGGPHLVGIVERIGENPRHREVMLRMQEPAPGVALIGTYEWGGEVKIAISLYFYGDNAGTIAAGQEPIWQAWIENVVQAGRAEGPV
jgi:uncharacterized protein YndB with AHSA1/START domain